MTEWNREDIISAGYKYLQQIGREMREDWKDDVDKDGNNITVSLSGTTEILRTRILNFYDEWYYNDTKPEPVPELIPVPAPESTSAPTSKKVKLAEHCKTRFMDFFSGWEIYPGQEKDLPVTLTDGIKTAFANGTLIYIK